MSEAWRCPRNLRRADYFDDGQTLDFAGAVPLFLAQLPGSSGTGHDLTVCYIDPVQPPEQRLSSPFTRLKEWVRLRMHDAKRIGPAPDSVAPQ
jgi:hypothetical protein